MLGELPGDTGHVFRGPCEDVLVLTEEVDKLAFLFAAESGSDDDVLAGVGRVERDLLGVLGRLERQLSSSLVVLCGRLGQLLL